jgi:prophage regulatory protein
MQTENVPTLISLNAACALTSLSRTGINKARAAGRFPQAVEIHGRRIAFVRAEIVDWINARIAARDGAAQ